MNKTLTEKEFEDYFLSQTHRITKVYNVWLNNIEMEKIKSFADEHLTDSHQLCDLIKAVVKIIKYREGEKCK